MISRIDRVGTSQSPVVTIDGFTHSVSALIEMAAGMAPLPPMRGNSYPGLRRVITSNDGAALRLVEQLADAAAPFAVGAFDLNRLDLVEASFSMVTTPPDMLAPQQRVPHFDSTDQRYIAFLLYLSDTPDSGTAFYRQRGTGIETIDDANLRSFVDALPEREPERAYITASNEAFEQIHAVTGLPGRLVMYRGCLLHSGIIPPHMPLSPDPRAGRLTLNLFLQG